MLLYFTFHSFSFIGDLMIFFFFLSGGNTDLTLQFEHLVPLLDGKIMMPKWQWPGKYVTQPRNLSLTYLTGIVYFRNILTVHSVVLGVSS